MGAQSVVLKYGTQHSMVAKYQLAVSLLVVTVRAISQEPLLFMAPGDVSDAWGVQYAVASQATDVSGSSFTQHPGLLGMVQGGLLPPNPARGGSDFEIFFTAKCADCNETTSGEALYYMTTRDFSSYSTPVRVLLARPWLTSKSPSRTSRVRCGTAITSTA